MKRIGRKEYKWTLTVTLTDDCNPQPLTKEEVIQSFEDAARNGFPSGLTYDNLVVHNTQRSGDGKCST